MRTNGNASPTPYGYLTLFRGVFFSPTPCHGFTHSVSVKLKPSRYKGSAFGVSRQGTRGAPNAHVSRQGTNKRKFVVPDTAHNTHFLHDKLHTIGRDALALSNFVSHKPLSFNHLPYSTVQKSI